MLPVVYYSPHWPTSADYNAQHWTLCFPTAQIFYFYCSNSGQSTTLSQFPGFPRQDSGKKIWNIIWSQTLDLKPVQSLHLTFFSKYNLNLLSTTIYHVEVWNRIWKSCCSLLSFKLHLDICSDSRLYLQNLKVQLLNQIITCNEKD